MSGWNHLATNILVPLDVSSSTQPAAAYAVLLAAELRASLTLLHVLDNASAMEGIVPGARADQDRLISLGHLGDERARLLPVFVQRGQPPEELKAELAEGPIAGTVLEWAKRGHFDLIVTGTHGRRGLSRLMLGSVAEEIVRGATCPVLIVHVPPD